MSKSIYGKLAVTNLKNNGKIYIPYLLTAMLTVMMFFMIDSLYYNENTGDGSLRSVLQYTTRIVVFFSVIFLFYTNSFLIKRRKKEIGVYNILGMGKRHIGKMLAMETLITAAASIGGGLAAGIVFSRLLFLILLKILHSGIRFEFQLSVISVVNTLILFTGIFILILLYNLLQIRLANPVELLQGGTRGEKEPRTRWLMAAAAILLLGTGYYIANTTESPLAAIPMFFLAVICVILGTYGLFVAGSIAILKLLKRKKGFYYQTRHFVAVSGMIYRMKQNAVGLGNICILSTMVLVLISTSVSMYVGMDNVLENRFPYDVEIEKYASIPEEERMIQEIVEEEMRGKQVEITEELFYHFVTFPSIYQNGVFELNEVVDYSSEMTKELKVIPLEDYNRIAGKNLELQEDEILMFYSGAEDYGRNTAQIGERTYRVAEELDSFKISPRKKGQMTINVYYVVMKDAAQIQELMDSYYEKSPEDWKERYTRLGYEYYFDVDGQEEACTKAMSAIQGRLMESVPDARCSGRELNRANFYILYGGLLFIGIYLGILFLMITVLIIYYKQISEGYEDKSRYQIMQKVGMSLSEVRSSIRSQVLMVFFLPLIMAVIHIGAAFKVITLLLALLNLTNVTLFFWCTVVTVAVFALFYAIVYALTAREYYGIVTSGPKGR